jgi:hypothetical protein
MQAVFIAFFAVGEFEQAHEGSWWFQYDAASLTVPAVATPISPR